MFDLPQEATNQEPAIPEPLLNPPAIVRKIDLAETTFGACSRFRKELPVEADMHQLENKTDNPQGDVETETPLSPLPKNMPAAFYDGALLGSGNNAYTAETGCSVIEGVLPAGGLVAQSDSKILYINGISTSPGMAFQNMQCTANVTGSEIVGIYNATDGNIADVLQAMGDKWSIGNNPAVTTLAQELHSAIAAGEGRDLIGDSHGGLIISRALNLVISELQEKGWEKDAIEVALSHFRVETFGGAAWTYPDGPKYVHYVNEYDPIPFHFGLTAHGLTEAERIEVEKNLVEPDWMKNLTGFMNYLGVNYFAQRDPGKDARIIRFKTPSDSGWLGTHMTSVYLEQRTEFDRAYKGESAVSALIEMAPFAKIALRFALTGLGIIALGRLAKKSYRQLFQKKAIKENEVVEVNPMSPDTDQRVPTLESKKPVLVSTY